MSRPLRYSKRLRWLHWGTVVLVILQVQAALTIPEISQAEPDRARALISFHASLGLVLLVAMAARLVFRLRDGVPAMVGVMRWPAHLAHGAMYALVAGMVLSGWVKMAAAGVAVPVFWGLALPALPPDPDLAAQARDLHTVMGRGLVGLILLHVAASLAHGTLLPGKVFYKMLPGEGAPRP